MINDFFKLPKKSLGQNFLIDKNIIRKIINIIDVKKNNIILEIGPGYGALTKELINFDSKFIYAVEKDKILYEFLKNKFSNFKNLKLINSDILDLLKKNKLKKNVIVFGNLPYNISTQILASFITLKKWPPWYDNLILMFQKEVADRILSKSNSKKFGRISILANWRLDIKKQFDISKNCFFPKPKVNSTVLSFKPKVDRFNIQNAHNLERVTRIMFSSRRKIIKKKFLKLFHGDKTVAQKFNLTLNERPEELSSETFYKITAEYEKLTR
mgnify:CR=1 FL=1|tara:strand:- start:5313 stop:6122 length:810 start_codon:yes stop_codon:yes gene_type:complete